MDFMAQLIFPRTQFFLMGEQFYEGGLPCPVHTHKRDALAAFDHEIYFVKDLMIINAACSIALGNIRELGDNSSARFRLRKRKVNSLLFFRNFNSLYLFELFNSALNLLCLGGGVTEAIDKNFKLLDAIALRLV